MNFDRIRGFALLLSAASLTVACAATDDLSDEEAGSTSEAWTKKWNDQCFNSNVVDTGEQYRSVNKDQAVEFCDGFAKDPKNHDANKGQATTTEVRRDYCLGIVSGYQPGARSNTMTCWDAQLRTGGIKDMYECPVIALQPTNNHAPVCVEDDATNLCKKALASKSERNFLSVDCKRLVSAVGNVSKKGATAKLQHMAANCMGDEKLKAVASDGINKKLDSTTIHNCVLRINYWVNSAGIDYN